MFARKKCSCQLLFILFCGGCGGSEALQPATTPPLGTYVAANQSQSSGYLPLITFPTAAGNTCLGLFDSRITLTSESSLLEGRRYLEPFFTSNGVVIGTITVEPTETAAYTIVDGNHLLIQHSGWTDTAVYSRDITSDRLTVRELFLSDPDCRTSTRNEVVYVRQ
jgi:hypothetical protein